MGANAQTSVPAFTAGQVLTAAQVTGINTGIPVFASSTERDAAFGGTGEKTLAEGQMAYLEDTNATQYYDGSSWAAIAGGKIVQIVSTLKTDTASESLATATMSTSNISGLEATITPTSSSNTILVMVEINGSTSGDPTVAGQIFRDSTAVGIGATAGSRTSLSGFQHGAGQQSRLSMSFIDSPATTSAITYGFRNFNASSLTRTIYTNRSSADTDTAIIARTASTITVMEISA